MVTIYIMIMATLSFAPFANSDETRNHRSVIQQKGAENIMDPAHEPLQGFAHTDAKFIKPQDVIGHETRNHRSVIQQKGAENIMDPAHEPLQGFAHTDAKFIKPQDVIGNKEIKLGITTNLHGNYKIRLSIFPNIFVKGHVIISVGDHQTFTLSLTKLDDLWQFKFDEFVVIGEKLKTVYKGNDNFSIRKLPQSFIILTKHVAEQTTMKTVSEKFPGTTMADGSAGTTMAGGATGTIKSSVMTIVALLLSYYLYRVIFV